MQIPDPSVFKAYDIRGLTDSQLTEELAYHLGRAFVAHTNATRVVVGHDMRESSVVFKEAVFKGLVESGVQVIDIGMCTTPMINHASGKLDADAIMITASHNPKEYNGFKLMHKGAVPIGLESGLKDIMQHIEDEDYMNADTQGSVTQDPSIKQAYVSFVSSFAKAEGKKLKVVVDCANAMGAVEIDVFKALSEHIELITLYEELDGNFPNHEANPLKYDTLQDLQKKVLEEGADLGIAFDGDADRCGIVDEKGQIIEPSYVTALIAESMLETYPGRICMYDLRSSKVVSDVISENGGVPKETRVGHAYIKQMLREADAVFAGELSGHYYFIDNFFTESSSLAGLHLMNRLWETGKTMSQLAEPLHRYSHSGEINREVEDKDAVLTQLKEVYKDGELSELDGIKVVYADWWFNVRKSNTENLLRFVVEANTKELMEQKRDELLSHV